MMLTKAWKRLAGAYMRAADVMRAADYNPNVSDAEYSALIDARERAYAALEAESRREEVRS